MLQTLSPIHILTLTQDEAIPPAPGEQPATGGAVTGAPAGPGAPGTGAGAARSPFGDQFFIILILLVGGMLLFSVLGQRRDRKKREAMISAIKKHDRVQTVGGVIGSVVDVKPDHVVLKVDESSNTRITFARSAIQQILTVSPELVSTQSDGAPPG